MSEKQNDTTADTTKSTSRDENVFDVTRAFDSDVETGAIVTDKKGKRWSFTKALGHAISGWTNEKVEKAKEKSVDFFKEPPKPKVTTAVVRKEVVQKAAAGGGLAPKDDHELVVEKLKAESKEKPHVVSKPILVKKAKAKEAPHWSHVIDEADSNEEGGRKAPEAPAALAPEPVEEKTDVILPEISFPTVSTKENVVPEKPQEKPVPTPAPPVFPPSETIAYPTRPPESPQPVTLPEKQDEHPQSVLEALAAARGITPHPVEKPHGRVTPSVTQIILLGVVVIAVFGGIATSVIIFSERSNGVADGTEDEVVVPSFIQTSAQIPVPLSNNKSALIDSLRGALESSSDSIVQVYPTFNEVPATSEEIFDVIAPRVSGGFVRTLEDKMMFGSVTASQKTPFIILRSLSFDTAFAGMLEWEDNIIPDFAPLFGSPLRSEASFVDETLSNHSVRTLTNDSGNVRLIYGFVNRETIAITESREVMQFLIDAIP